MFRDEFWHLLKSAEPWKQSTPQNHASTSKYYESHSGAAMSLNEENHSSRALPFSLLSLKLSVCP